MQHTIVTLAIPEALMGVAGAMVHELGRADTPDIFDRADWHDPAGNLFAISSGYWPMSLVDAIRGREGVTIAAPGDVPALDAITAVLDLEGLAALASIGLARSEVIDI